MYAALLPTVNAQLPFLQVLDFMLYNTKPYVFYSIYHIIMYCLVPGLKDITEKRGYLLEKLRRTRMSQHTSIIHILFDKGVLGCGVSSYLWHRLVPGLKEHHGNKRISIGNVEKTPHLGMWRRIKFLNFEFAFVFRSQQPVSLIFPL